MCVNSILSKAIVIRSSLLVLSLASLLGASVVQSQTVSADFGGRSGATPVVPIGLFSVGGTGTNSVKNQGSISTLTTAGLDRTRFWIPLEQVYATSTPDFKFIDWTLRIMRNAHLHPLAVIVDTPPSLGAKTCSAPSNIAQWGQMAASVVAHVDQKFPGLLQDYEIWNEPEMVMSLCVTDPTARLNTYVSMFASAASAMHAQAAADGQTIRTGGPVISQLSAATTWFPGLLNNASTAPFVDFVSFHLYITGQTEITNGMTWASLYSTTQSAKTGLASYYQTVEPLVRRGNQPNALTTPIFITEYNVNWAYAVDCCRNDLNYGPLWNSVAIADLLNVVYSGATAVPSQLSYFAASGKYFCLLGRWDYNMDCNPSVMTPYPQFYAFKLFASADYLNLQAGGNMAVSVSPGSTTSGLDATAFYTKAGDDVVIMNPTSTSYGAVNVTLNNPGFTSASATQFLLNSANDQISSRAVTLNAVAGGYSVQVAVPAYSTLAISLKGNTALTPTLSFTAIAGQNVGSAPFAVSATSASSGTVTYSVVSGPAIVSKNMVTLTSAGKVVLSASQAASGNYTTATAKSSFTVAEAIAPKAALTVTQQSPSNPFLVSVDSAASQAGSGDIVGRTTDFGDGVWVNWQSKSTHTYKKTGSYKIAVRIKNSAGQVSSASTVINVK
jgi:PKD domain/Glycosyl hydrolases family 39